MENYFNELNKIDVSSKVEKKNGLSYLSWSWAWAEFKKKCPNATYEIKLFNGLPYIYDERTGYMVFTSVCVDGLTHEMWLPVMDNNNKSMKDKPYTYKTSYGEKTVAPATMFDINKTIMRCLVKNLAMFGLGLYIYSGEDLPENVEVKQEEKVAEASILEMKKKMIAKIKSLGIAENDLCTYYRVKSIEEMSIEQMEQCIALKMKKINKK